MWYWSFLFYSYCYWISEVLVDIGTGLFYQMAARMDPTVIRFPPTIQFFSSCIEILGKVNCSLSFVTLELQHATLKPGFHVNVTIAGIATIVKNSDLNRCYRSNSFSSIELCDRSDRGQQNTSRFLGKKKTQKTIPRRSYRIWRSGFACTPWVDHRRHGCYLIIYNIV